MKLCVTKKVSDFLGFSALQDMQMDDFMWHVHFITFNRKKMFVFCHALTGYSLYMYGIKKSDFKNSEALLLKSLKESLISSGYPIEAIEAYMNRQVTVDFGKTSSRAVIGQTTTRTHYGMLYLEHFNPDTIHQSLMGYHANRLLGKTQSPNVLMKNLLLRYLPEGYTYKAHVFNIVIDLEKSEVIRQLVVPSTFRLFHLHEAIQIAFGWNNEHLHLFHDTVKDLFYEVPHPYEPFSDTPCLDETLHSVELALTNDLIYEYDFGDSWMHHITYVKTISSQNEINCECVSYEGDTIPENVGGVLGYLDFLEVISNPNHEDYLMFNNWFNSIAYTPFDLNNINRLLRYIPHR